MPHKILIVDDSKFTRNMIRAPLVKVGYEVVDFENPHAALDAIGKEQPDLIISDLKMPSLMDGLGFLKMLGLQSAQLPVIVYTSDPNPEASVGDTGLQHISFIKKPVSPVELRRKVKELLG